MPENVQPARTTGPYVQPPAAERGHKFGLAVIYFMRGECSSRTWSVTQTAPPPPAVLLSHHVAVTFPEAVFWAKEVLFKTALVTRLRDTAPADGALFPLNVPLVRTVDGNELRMTTLTHRQNPTLRSRLQDLSKFFPLLSPTYPEMETRVHEIHSIAPACILAWLPEKDELNNRNQLNVYRTKASLRNTDLTMYKVR